MRNLLIFFLSGLLFLGCQKNNDGSVTVVPLPPTELTATVISTTQVNLSWSDKSTNEDGFKIQRKTGTGNFADIGTVGKDVTNYSDNGLTPATTYTYRVYAYNSTGASLTYTNEVTVITNQDVPSSLINGLVAYYPFNGNANDESGNGKNGTVNGATLTIDRFGNTNKAYSFNGTNNSINTTFNGISGSNSRTISLWAKTTSNVATDGMAAVSWGKEGLGNRFDAFFNFAAVGATANIAGAAITYSTPTPVNNNQWNHYIFMLENSKNKLNEIKVFQNGVLLTTILSTYGQPTTLINTLIQTPLFIGRSVYNGIPAYFLGQLDDIRIYNRALTQAEITHLANN